MDTTIEDLTLLLLSLTATRDSATGDGRSRASLRYPAAVVTALIERGLIDAGNESSITLTAAGLRMAETLEDRYLDAGERPDLAA